uniref:Cysteine-rich venom protein-like n=1 Tax=Dromaius novaehollandiae TaxID=8790 RepID=A0A8C4JZV3_DRONO
MGPLLAIIFLAALLHQSAGQVRAFIHVQKKILDQHNEIRRSVIPTASNMLKMEWSEKAAISAQKWANKCQMKSSVPCDENILQLTYPKTWSEAISTWYSQIAGFKYGSESLKYTANIQSYTQLIQYNSYQVGCAVAYCPNSRFNYFYVCHYYPPRNNQVPAATPYKIGPKCGDCPGHCDRGLCTNPCKLQDLLTNCANLRSLFGCDFEMVRKKCPAACRCTTEII